LSGVIQKHYPYLRAEEVEEVRGALEFIEQTSPRKREKAQARKLLKEINQGKAGERRQLIIADSQYDFLNSVIKAFELRVNIGS